MTSVDFVSILRNKYRIRSQLAREFFAEFLGTCILIVFGNGAVAQAVLTSFKVNSSFSIFWGYALGVTFGVLSSAGISGGHINPAVTIAMAVWGKFPWKKVPVYIVAQYFGAFFASCIVYWVYIDALQAFESTPSLMTAGIWATYPGSSMGINGTMTEHLTLSNGITDQVWGTMILLIGVCAINDNFNAKLPDSIRPLFVGLLVLSIGMSYGFNCGYAINPARDLAPRIFTLIAGWGELPFTATTVDGYAWWWVPVVGPHLGAILGVFFYTLLIEMHHPPEESTSKSQDHALAILDGDKLLVRELTVNRVHSSQNAEEENISSLHRNRVLD